LWKLSGEDVLKLLTPKLKRAYGRMKKGKKNADPRLGASLSMTEITTHGERII